MRKLVRVILAALPLVVGGLAYAKSQAQNARPVPAIAEGYICPLTGEELPCPNCCPLCQK
jgi:hypothetical protein